MSNYFFIIFLGTILFTRIFVFLFPIPAPTIGKFRVHHWMYGVLAILISLAINSIIIYAIGLGLFVDELTYILMRGKNHRDNYSRMSLYGTLIFVILAFIFRSYLVLPFI